jgi:hypothetical protein
MVAFELDSKTAGRAKTRTVAHAQRGYRDFPTTSSGDQ